MPFASLVDSCCRTLHFDSFVSPVDSGRHVNRAYVSKFNLSQFLPRVNMAPVTNRRSLDCAYNAGQMSIVDASKTCPNSVSAGVAC